MSLTPDETPAAPAGSPVRRTNTARIVIVIGAVALLVALIALLIWFLVPQDDTPGPWRSASPSATSSASGSTSASPSATSSDEPAASAAPTPTAAPSAPAQPTATISSFAVTPEIAACPDERGSTAPLTFTWESSGGERAWIGVGTNDASAQPFAEVSLTSSGYTDVVYECRGAEQLFTLTVQGPDGSVSSSLSVVREID